MRQRLKQESLIKTSRSTKSEFACYARGLLCAELSPDIAKATQTAIDAAFKNQAVNAQVGYSHVEAIAQLVEQLLPSSFFEI